jgi:hypothetical protein
MAIDEAMRHRIHERLGELLGPEEAAAFMTSALPPEELATKVDIQLVRADLDHLREMLTLEIKRSTTDLGSALRAEMNQQYRFMLQWVTGAMLAAGSLGLAAGRLLGG